MRSHPSAPSRPASDREIAPRPARRIATRDLAPIAAAVAAIIVYGGSLPYFFGQDDFLGLARVRGIVPAMAGPWRWLSGQGDRKSVV
jgi:hypothetical protein